MSKTTIVGGKMYVFVGGDHITYSEESIITSAKTITETGVENGVSYGEPQNAPPIFFGSNLPAKCIVQFRPRNNWKGEFGFDWFRIGDTGLDGDVNYETIVGQYYDKAILDKAIPEKTIALNSNANTWTKFFKADPQPDAFSASDKIKALKKVYGIFEYSLENDASEKHIIKEYYKPVIALYPTEPDPTKAGKFIETGKAKLELYLEFEKIDGNKVKPDKIIFEMDNALMDNTHPLVSIDNHTIVKSKIEKKIDIEITCKVEFAEDKEIKVWAITEDTSGKQIAKLQAGILKMIAPAKKTVKDIVVVKVTTPSGTGNPLNLKIFKKNLKQALIKTSVVEEVSSIGGSKKVTIDLSNPVNNLYNADFNLDRHVDTSINNRKNITRTTGLDNLLIRTLERDYPGQFDNHFKLFFLDNTCDAVFDPADDSLKSSTAGYSRSDENYHYGVMFGNHSEETIAHECLHGLGLPHSFFGDTFLYRAQKTDNIMDYSHLGVDKVNEGIATKIIDRIATWYWQWKIINNL